MCHIWYMCMPMIKSKGDLVQTKIHVENTILILRPRANAMHRMNVCNTSSYVDILRCQIWYDYVKGQKSCGRNISKALYSQRTVSYRDHEHMLHITSYSDRPMLQIRCYNIRALRMYVTHPLMVRDLHVCAKYGKLMSKQKKLRPGHEDTSKPINFTLGGGVL